MKSTTNHALEQDHVKAIALMTLATFLLSTMDVGLKHLVEHYPSFQVVFLRCIASAPVFATWMLIRDRTAFRVRYPADHLLRAAIGLVMLYAVGECFRELQLADAYALFFAAPLLMTLLSGPVLGEKAGPFRIAAAAIGFVGVLIVLQPGVDSTLISYGAAMGLVGVVAYAATGLLLRRMGHHDRTVTITFWFTALVGTGAGIFAIPVWKPLMWEHWPWIALIVVTGTGGQLTLTSAFQRASAAVIAPFDYTHMLWAVLYGFIFWGYLPAISTWVGTVVIMGSGLYIIYREHRMQKKRRVKGMETSLPGQVPISRQSEHTRE
jgi:drug/metabolite transporter (DMT)-like permease